MVIKNKLLAWIILAFSIFNLASANTTNKDFLLNEISSLETKIVNLKTSASSSLEDKVYTLSTSYDAIFTKLWYDTKTVSYLVSLWKLTSNFKEDLTLELNTLNKEISDKTTIELNSLSTIKNNIRLNYTTVSDSQKTTLLNSIKAIESNYLNLSDSFTWKITTLNNKYTSSLSDYETKVKNAYNSSVTSIQTLNNFSTKYEALYTLNQQFEKNYQTFKDVYLAYAWDLTLFSESKQKYYIEALRKELEKIRDWNIEANKSLESYKVDIDRLIEILLQNFENSLILKINESYGVLYSDSDISSINSRFTTAKNRYYDLDWKLKATEVISNTWALEEINFLNEKLTEINSKVVSLIWTWGYVNTYENVKIRLENEMVKFYNENYKSYREDLLLRIKEKLNIVALETKNIILAADTIDLRFSLLNDKISKSNDINFINTQINNFKDDVSKYAYLNSSVLNTKISNLENNLDIFIVEKELAQFKYNKMSQTGYTNQLAKIFAQLKSRYPEKYKDKLKIVLNRVNTALKSTKLDDKTRFMLLVVKLNIVKFIK